MKATKLFLAAIAALAFASCQNDEELPKLVTASIFGNIGEKTLATRAYNNKWEANDEIGLFVYTYDNETSADGEQHRNYVNSLFKTVSGGDTGEFTPGEGVETIMFPSDNGDIHIYAYYPHTNLDGTSFKVNWTNQSSKIDLMLANKIATINDKRIELQFRHRFSKLILKVTANTDKTQILPDELEGMTVSARGMNFDSSCDVKTGVLTKGSAKDAPISFVYNNGQYEAIVCPDAINANRSITFTLSKYGTKNFVWNTESLTNVPFAEGKSYIWNVCLNGEDIVEAELVGTIDDWDPQPQNSEENPENVYITKQ